jgi:hypothetical protein
MIDNNKRGDNMRGSQYFYTPLKLILITFKSRKETLLFLVWKSLASKHGMSKVIRNNISYLEHLNDSESSWFYIKLKFNWIWI